MDIELDHEIGAMNLDRARRETGIVAVAVSGAEIYLPLRARTEDVV